MQRLITAQGSFQLSRLPLRKHELLQAWDAADEYLLAYAADRLTPFHQSNILIANDSFGALALALADFRPQVWSDSYISQQATQLNFATNGRPIAGVTLLNSLETPSGDLDWVFIKLPKTLALLEFLLITLLPNLTAKTELVVAGMTKYMTGSVWTLLENLIGTTHTLPARKKAKLICVKPVKKPHLVVNPYPVIYQMEGTGYRLSNHANVFSRDSLDIGTRFFLQHISQSLDAKNIVDLGCGNGIVGIMAAQNNPRAKLFFTDESYMAVASAQENFTYAFDTSRAAEFFVGNGLENFQPGSMDLILCNPPFHQQNAIGNQIADMLFKQACNVLNEKGELWVIGNRHLKYFSHLKRYFGYCETVAANNKFTVIKALKTNLS